MKFVSLNRLCFKLMMLVLLALPIVTEAQYFTDTDAGDVVAGFRKTGSAQEQYEMVVYLGNITNFLVLPAGTTINITNYIHQQLTNMCPNNLNNLQWSVFSSFDDVDPLTTSVGNFPQPTCWFTAPRSNPNNQTTPPARSNPNAEFSLQARVVGVSDGAYNLASNLGATNTYDNTLVLLESITFDSSSSDTLTYFIGDRFNANVGDFYGDVLTSTVEDNTSNSFTAPVVSDFYQDVPYSTASVGTYTDPITGQTNGNCYYVGYFTLSPGGTMTFTRASLTPPAPVAAFSGSPTVGFAHLNVVFTDATTGSGTNWLWTLGDGISVTNGTSASVNHTYTNSGNYTVSLKVTGAGGSSIATSNNYVVVFATPTISTLSYANGKMIFGGLNGPSGVQYRILGATNLTTPLGSWKPVFTNTFNGNGGFSFTNSTTNAASYFRLVSP